MTDIRPPWTTQFMSIAKLTSLRSNCIRRNVGCIVVKDNRILSLGQNGTPRGHANCFEGGCKRCNSTQEVGAQLDLCMCLHAEDNALLFVSKEDLAGSEMQCTLFPCIACIKKIIQCQIKTVFQNDIQQESLFVLGKKILEEASIETIQIS